MAFALEAERYLMLTMEAIVVSSTLHYAVDLQNIGKVDDSFSVMNNAGRC